MHAVPPATIRDRLLSEAVRRREVSARAVTAIEDLLSHGLSFEQALVGTGLVSREVFLEWMTSATGLPLLTPSDERRDLPTGLEWDTVVAWQVVPQKTGKAEWTIGLTDPWNTDVRSALEALAVEQGWALVCAYVLPSEADRWVRRSEDARFAHRALRQYARSLVDRLDQEERLTIHQVGAVTPPGERTASVSPAWLPALHVRLKRRLHGAHAQVHHHRHHRHAHIQIQRAPMSPSHAPEEEHPIHTWTDTIQRFLDQGKVVFVLDEGGEALHPWSELHVAHETEEWRAGKRWMVAAQAADQEELFHLALAGYPGTVSFSSVQELGAWERAAEATHLEYAVCKGQPTPHGMAWSVYSV